MRTPSARPSNGWAHIQPTVSTAGVILFFLLLSVSPVWGQPASPSSSPPVMQLDDLVQEALRANPAIQASRSRHEAATTKTSRARTLPDPTFTLTQMSDGTPLPFGHLGKEPFSWYGLTVAQPVLFPGKRALHGRYAFQEAASLEHEAEATTFHTIAQVKRAYYDLSLIDRSLDVVAKNKDLLERVEQIARTKYTVGQGHQEQMLRAQLELSLLIERVTVLEQRRSSAIAQLNRLLNRPPDRPLAGKTAPIAPVSFPYTLDDLLREANARSPRLRARQSLVDRERVGIDLARRAVYPDFSVMYTYLNRPAFTDMWEIKVDVQVPLWSRPRLGVREATATLEAARQEYQDAAQQLAFDINEEYLTVTAEKRLIDLYEGAIMPQAALAAESALSGYQVGSVDFLTLLNTFTVQLNYELQYHEHVVLYHKTLVRLEELTALSLMR